MSTDLRDTLRREAARVNDHDPSFRAAAVHERVRRIRRRRAGAGVVVAAALVAAVAGGTALVVTPGRGVPTVAAGQAVPRTTTSLGATYRVSDVATGHRGRLDVTLAAEDMPRVVRWASATSAGHLVLSGSVVTPSWRTEAGGFGTFVQVPAGAGATLHLRQVGADRPGDVAIATYTFAEASPGDTVQGLTYRSSVNGQPLVGAAIGRRGEDRASVRLGGFSGQLVFKILCDARSGLEARITLAGKPIGGVGCITGAVRHTDRGADAAEASAGSLSSQETYRGNPTLTVRLVDKNGHAVAARPDDRVAVAAYLDVSNASDLPRAIDLDGHHWQFREGFTSPAAVSSQRFETSGEDRYLVHWELPIPRELGRLRFGGRTFDLGTTVSGGRTFGSAEHDAGQAPVVVTYPTPPTSGRIRIGVYDLAD